MKTVKVLAFLLAAGVSSLQASVVTFYLSSEFSGADSPKGTTPWVTATIDDSFGDLNTVRLSISTTNLVDQEFVSGFYLNLNPAFNPLGLTFDLATPASNPTGLVLSDISQGVNLFKADGDGDFDLLLNFPQTGNRFQAGETFVMDISRAGGLSALDFAFPDEGGTKGDLYAAAHIQGISILDPGTGVTSPSGSGWIGAAGFVSGGDIPEPSSYAVLLAFATAAVVGFRRMRRTEA